MPMKSQELCLRLSDCSSVREIVSKASVLLKNTGHKEWAMEMKRRINEAKTTEEIFEIIDDYVEII